MATEPEIGQMLFGAPTGDYGMPEYADALVHGLLSEIERVYWNLNQKEWDRYADPGLPGVEYHSYWWGDEDAPEAERPNLSFGDGVEVRWYKYPGRGSTVNKKMSAADWCEWFTRAHALICKADLDI